ncbi:hypothetical protein GGI25_001758 [Coemansia spiralis]|uniref:BZIP domain-containing protein n=2 Tax=Coemansia TaxID=4863 RepID=A0A9W8KZS6_9FUNG|nr:hypothetical protein BX070DRAFT_250866 [Coemansia spiralis]KAJ1990569.1 hypothetical protein EDC05_003989 [Coemansia umbellata]KAJ2624902.1 hypothetical protein GGI26_001014 [Coemansia sp. RSA 1358]KAJ2679190.1 hypothetical protein GGI25_001758 [Coemansia spiralis]
MDKIFSIVSAAQQQAPAFAQQDDNNPYILPSFADNYEAWAYPDTQQTIFEDWIATATPPSTAIASPNLGQNAALFAASVSQMVFPSISATSSITPSLSPPSSDMSASNSPLLASDIALSFASSLPLQSTVAATPLSASPQQQHRMFTNGLTVADYAAALFPDIAASLSSALTSPAITADAGALPRRASSSVSLQLPCVAAESAVGWSADISSLFETSPHAATTSVTPTTQQQQALVPDMSATASALTVKRARGSSSNKSRLVKPRAKAVKPRLSEPAHEVDSTDVSIEEQRKRRDTEFLASLPPQLALKRRRTSNSKQKEKILAELLETSTSDASSKHVDSDEASCDDAVVISPVDAVDEHDADAVEPADQAALKRKKNTDAARRSRMRKILRIETLEGRVSDLETENSRLSQMVADLEADRAAMAQRMEEYENRFSCAPPAQPSFVL